jgi:hypothetical protein
MGLCVKHTIITEVVRVTHICEKTAFMGQQESSLKLRESTAALLKEDNQIGTDLFDAVWEDVLGAKDKTVRPAEAVRLLEGRVLILPSFRR